MSKKKKEPRIVIKKVASDKSKIKFTAEFEGELDWNELFGADENEFSLCDNFNFQYGGDNFSQSFINFIFDTASSNDDFKIFKKAKLTKIDISEEVQRSYKNFKDEIESREKLKKLEALKKAEKEVARLRGEVLKEFQN